MPRSTAKTSSSTSSSTSAARPRRPKHLVIVESPAKARTINKYLGPDFTVMASLGHIRDLPEKPAKGNNQPVPGVDIEHDFAPTYEILPDKKKIVAQLQKAARNAADVWFATDLDREGEAIAWHLAQILNIPPDKAKRVVFNAITKSQIEQAFANPRPIDENKVNAQQARRILDRIVGYQVSPLLWKKVARGLSAGRVQSVAVRLVVEREREIESFIPQEYWRIVGYFTADLAAAPALAQAWRQFLTGSSHPESAPSETSDQPNGEETPDRPLADDGTAERKGPTLRQKIAWLNQHQAFRAELIELAGQPVQLSDRDQALALAQRLGFILEKLDEWQDPKGKGPARFLAVAFGRVDPADPNTPRFFVRAIRTERTTRRPPPPFITSTLQQAAGNQLGFSASRTMRIAQQLYEGVDLGGQLGPTGLITYMRTDSTHLSPEAVSAVRTYIRRHFGDSYLPDRPNVFSSSNRLAQEAHEAIRPTDVNLTPDQIRHALTDEQFKLYELIWRRFVACQMAPAQWDATTLDIETSILPPQSTSDQPIPALFRAQGSVLVFDGFYRVLGLPRSEQAILPPLSDRQPLACFHIDPTQHFTSPPPRYTEASLIAKLEKEGIGRPSTYATIMQTILDRGYVKYLSPRDRRLMATDLGKVVTDKLVEAFPEIMDVAYTRQMEAELDKIEEEHHDWLTMLRQFYGPFKERLDQAHRSMVHVRAETEPAPHTCPECGAPTVYRFGKNGRFLSCTRYPDCKYAAPIDAEGNPIGAELTDILCPLCGGAMIRRIGRFGPFLGCENYPKCNSILRLDRKKGSLITPKPPPLATDLPCPKCSSPLLLRHSRRGPWLSCSRYPRCRGRLAWSSLDPAKQNQLHQALAQHQTQHPTPLIRNREGQIVSDGYVPQIIATTPASVSSND